MFTIDLPEREWFDELSGEFKTTNKNSFQIEHSLVSLSKWESKWCKPFLVKDKKTNEETNDYIRCMTITQNVDPKVYVSLPNNVIDQIDAYVNAPMTATWFSDKKKTQVSREIVTAEIIYYWMITHNIPMECQKWHLNRLLTLIRVCNIKSAPEKKQGRREMLSQRAALNQARRSQHNTKG